jgi:hypothetical protein
MATATSRRAIDIHHHYVPMQLIEETRRHGEALGVGVTEVRGSYALSFAGSKPHRFRRDDLSLARACNKHQPTLSSDLVFCRGRPLCLPSWICQPRTSL